MRLGAGSWELAGGGGVGRCKFGIVLKKQEGARRLALAPLITKNANTAGGARWPGRPGEGSEGPRAGYHVAVPRPHLGQPWARGGGRELSQAEERGPPWMENTTSEDPRIPYDKSIPSKGGLMCPCPIRSSRHARGQRGQNHLGNR